MCIYPVSLSGSLSGIDFPKPGHDKYRPFQFALKSLFFTRQKNDYGAGWEDSNAVCEKFGPTWQRYASIMIERDRTQQNMPNNSQVHTVLEFEIRHHNFWRTFQEALSDKTLNEYIMSACFTGRIQQVQEFKKKKD